VFTVRSVPRQYNEDQLPFRVSPDRVGVESLQADGQLRVAVAGARGQLENPEEGERPPLEAVSKQRSEDRDWEHWSVCDL
jgi:hypothetical protein